MTWERCGDTGFYRKGSGLRRTYLDPIVMMRVRSVPLEGGGAGVTHEALTTIDPRRAIAKIPPEVVELVGRWAARVNDARQDVRPGWWRPLLEDLEVDRELRDQLLDVLDGFMSEIPEMATKRGIHVPREGLEKAFRKFGIPAC